MIELISAQNYLSMPWANGLGLTAQIDIFPKDASVAKQDFQWRVSAATVRENSPSKTQTFSLFPQYARLLTVISGDGLILNSHVLNKGEVLAFSGDEVIHYELVGSDVTDLGLIYSAKLFEAHAAIATWTHNREFKIADHSVGYLYAHDRALTCMDKSGTSLTAEVGDTVKLTGPDQVTLTANSDQECQCVYIHLRRKKI